MVVRKNQEGPVGLLILAGVGLFAGLIAWIQGVGLGQQRYRITVEFENAKGMQVGAVLNYRGVEIGKALAIRPTSTAVEVEVEIYQPELRIPWDSTIEVESSALLGDKYMNLIVHSPLTDETNLPLPVDPACNPEVIICDGSRVAGVAPPDLTDLIRSSNEIAELFTNPLLLAGLQEVLQGAGEATGGLKGVTQGFSTLATSLNSQVDNLGNTITTMGTAAGEIQTTAVSARNVLEENRGAIGLTLRSFGNASDNLTNLMGDLTPAVQQVTQGEMVDNLEVLTKNLRQASASLAIAGRAINDPENVQLLQETLDSARVTFQNAQKITSDLDELTGDAEVRDNLRRLLDNMGRLFGTAERLDRQVQALKVLSPPGSALEQIDDDAWVSADWATWQEDVANLQALLDQMDRAAAAGAAAGSPQVDAPLAPGEPQPSAEAAPATPAATPEDSLKDQAKDQTKDQAKEPTLNQPQPPVPAVP